MAEKKIKEIVSEIKELLTRRHIKVNKVVVFGSYASGCYNKSKGSDIDIAIVSKDFEGKNIFQKADMLKGLDWFYRNLSCSFLRQTGEFYC